MLRRFLTLCSASLALLLTASLAPAQSQIASRITQPIDETARVTLKGNVPPLARAEFDRGPAPVSTPYTSMRLVLKRSPQQEAALDKYLHDLQDKSSPNFHKWLTPAQFGKLYGPSDDDIQKLTGWLEGHGFKVTSVPEGRTTIEFSGTVGQAQDAFSVEIHSYQTSREQFFSNTADPQIPAALAPAVLGVAGLNTIKPRPMNHRGPAGQFDPSKKKFVANAASAIKPRGNYTEDDGNGYYSLWAVAGDAATIYDSPNSFNAKFSSGTSYTGKNATIGIIGDSSISNTYVQNYRKLFVGDSVAPTVTNVDGATENGDSGEAYLDNEIAGALAPGATIHFYTAQHLETAINQALTDNKVDILNVSFGLCEALLTTENATFNNWWKQAAAQGISVTVSTGDNGSAGCDDQNSESAAQYGMYVNGLGSTPYNIAVGGTDFAGLVTSSDSFSTYVSTSNNASLYRTAKSYIPESTWNDSTVLNTTVSANYPWDQTQYSITDNIVAASGGPSNCSTNTVDSQNNINCVSGYSKPLWQTGTGVPADKARDTPDVSLLAGNGIDSALWLVCDDGTDSNNDVLGCTKQSDGSFFYDGFGGTSAAAPAFAGMLAMVVEKYGRQGQAAQVLYDLANGSHGSSIFHDITVGNNSVECTQGGSSDCVLNDAGFYYEAGWDTTTGYDVATGLGSVDAANLVNYWNTAKGSLAATLTVTPAASSIKVNAGLGVTVTIAGPSGDPNPSGTITLSSGSYTSAATTIANGKVSLTIPASSLAIGSDTITATYSGDLNYASSTATATVTVTGSATGSIAVAANPATLTFAAGATSGNTSTVSVTPAGGYLGTVNLTCSVSGPSGAQDVPTCAFKSGSLTITGTTAASTTVTISSTTRTTSALQPAPRTNRWYVAGSGAALACLLFWGIPARRRSWRVMLGLLFIVTVAGIGCGGGSGSGGGGGGGTTTGTTAGAYTVTLTATDSTTSSITGSATIAVTVN